MIKSTLSVLALVGTASLAMAMPGHGDGEARSSGCGMASGGQHAMGASGQAMPGERMAAMSGLRAQHMQQMHGKDGAHMPAMGRHGSPDAAETPAPQAPN